jgi:hypothetical protein
LDGELQVRQELRARRDAALAADRERDADAPRSIGKSEIFISCL